MTAPSERVGDHPPYPPRDETLLGWTGDGFSVVQIVMADGAHLFQYRHDGVGIAQATTLRELAEILRGGEDVECAVAGTVRADHPERPPVGTTV